MGEAAQGYRLGVQVLLHSKWRCLAASLGIAMGVVIMFLEAGFFFGILDSQARIASLVQGDLVIQHRARTHLNKWQELPRIRLSQIEASPGVAAVAPIYKGTMGLESAKSGRIKRIVVYAWSPDDQPLNVGEPTYVASRLKLNRSVLFDRRSRNIYGDPREDDEVRLDGRPYRVAGLVDIGPGIVSDGAMVMSRGLWLERNPNDEPIMGIVRLNPEADLETVRQRLLALAPGELSVLTPAELRRREMLFIVSAVPIGIIFGIGLLAGLVVGSITCYQVLFNEIVDQLRQFAMLKAVGFSNGFLRRIILAQALTLSLLGFAIAAAISYATYAYLAEETALVMRHTGSRLTVLLLLTLVMCLAAALLAMRRAAFKNPAELI